MRILEQPQFCEFKLADVSMSNKVRPKLVIEPVGKSIFLNGEKKLVFRVSDFTPPNFDTFK